MKLAEWARVNGVRKDTAYRWFHAGILPAAALSAAGAGPTGEPGCGRMSRAGPDEPGLPAG